MLPLAFVDIETTGSNFDRDQITEVAVVTLINGEIQYYETLINPNSYLPVYIQTLTGITPEMLHDKPVFADIAPELHEQLSQKIFIAHNARFDYGFLKSAFHQVGLEFRPKVVCTVKLSRLLFPSEKKHNLDSIIKRCGLINASRHRAMGDALTLLQFWQHCERKFGTQRVIEAAQSILGRPSLPPHIDAQLINSIPDSPGVYIFYGENNECLYIGKSKTIKTRVLSHFQSATTNRKEAKLSMQIRHIDWIETSGELGALLLESDLIKKRLPLLNIRLRKTSTLFAWQLNKTSSGYLSPNLISKNDLSPGFQDNLYGLFKSKREATNSLKDLAEKNSLCDAILGLESVKAGQPCFAYQLKRCAGDCVGKGNQNSHNLKLTTALQHLKISKWPYENPVAIKEGDVCHVFDKWCYLGSARTDEEIHDLLNTGTAQFDQDIYKIVRRCLVSTGGLKLFQLRPRVESSC